MSLLMIFFIISCIIPVITQGGREDRGEVTGSKILESFLFCSASSSALTSMAASTPASFSCKHLLHPPRRLTFGTFRDQLTSSSCTSPSPTASAASCPPRSRQSHMEPLNLTSPEDEPPQVGQQDLQSSHILVARQFPTFFLEAIIERYPPGHQLLVDK